MRIDAGTYMRAEQSMKLSPRMIQSMEILQLPTLALEERIDQELEQNPVLELEEKRLREGELKAGDDVEQPLVVADTVTEDASRDFERAADMAEQYGESWAQNTTESADYHPTRTNGSGDRDGKMDAMANTASRGPGLIEQLLDQWRFIDCDEAVHRAGELLLSFIGDDGYLRTEFEQVLSQAPPEIGLPELESALELIQTRLDPVGIGARDLRECLLLQIDGLIEAKGREEALVNARRLVKDHLKDIEMNRLPRIAQRTGLDIEQVKDALGALRRLDPRPGTQLAPARIEAITPDVIIEYDPVHDRYVAGACRGRGSGLRINPSYEKLARDKEQDATTRKYLNNNVSNARWLIDAISQRNTTLLRVVNIVLEAQREFFDYGPQHLKPLPMVQVAEQLGIHVGTVSRAVSEKYIQTPRGIFPLRQFFSGGTESSDGQEMSWAAVQAKLKAIIDGEDPKKPFSDDALVAQLREQGIEIARRTVAKYRQQMDIPPARKRKQF